MKRIIFSVLFTVLLASVGYAAPGDKIFYEDFSAYGLGELPAGWTGGERMGVKEVNNQRILQYFANGSYDVTTKNVSLPENFKATIAMKHYVHNRYKGYSNGLDRNRYIREREGNFIGIHFGGYQIWIGDGDILAGIVDNWSDWKELETVAPEKAFSLSLEKKGPVFILSVNNTRVFVQRFPDVTMTNIQFVSNSKFEIHSIVVEEL